MKIHGLNAVHSVLFPERNPSVCIPQHHFLSADSVRFSARSKEEQLRVAVDRFDANEVKLLLDTGADPNYSVNRDGLNLMFRLIYFIGCGAVTELKNGNDEIPLKLLDLMLAKGVQLNSPASGPAVLTAVQGLKPLSSNTRANALYLDLLNHLLLRGGDVNAANAEGVTPLMAAVESSQFPSVVKLLLDKGADPNAVNAKGKTIRDYFNAAEENALSWNLSMENVNQVRELLQSATGVVNTVAAPLTEKDQPLLQLFNHKSLRVSNILGESSKPRDLQYCSWDKPAGERAFWVQGQKFYVSKTADQIYEITSDDRQERQTSSCDEDVFKDITIKISPNIVAYDTQDVKDTRNGFTSWTNHTSKNAEVIAAGQAFIQKLYA